MRACTHMSALHSAGSTLANFRRQDSRLALRATLGPKQPHARPSSDTGPPCLAMFQAFKCVRCLLVDDRDVSSSLGQLGLARLVFSRDAR